MPRHRSCRSGPDVRCARGIGRGRPPRGDPRARDPTRERDVSHQHALDVQRLRRGRSTSAPTRRLCVERDRARPPVRRAAGLRPDRREPSAASGVLVRAVEARGRGHGGPVRAPHGCSARRPAHLEHHAARRLRGLPRLLGRPTAAALEPLGLRGRAGRRAGLRARADGTGLRGGGLHRRGGRYRDAAGQRRAPRRGVPDRADPRPGRGPRDPARDRTGALGARVRAALFLARRPRRSPSPGSSRSSAGRSSGR